MSNAFSVCAAAQTPPKKSRTRGGLLDPPDSLAGSARRSSSPPKRHTHQGRRTSRPVFHRLEQLAFFISSNASEAARPNTKNRDSDRGAARARRLWGDVRTARSKRAMCALSDATTCRPHARRRASRRLLACLFPNAQKKRERARSNDFKTNGPRATSAICHSKPVPTKKEKKAWVAYVCCSCCRGGWCKAVGGWGVIG